MKRLKSYLFSACLFAAAAPEFGQALRVEAIANSSAATSLLAYWSTVQDGGPLVSLIETLKDGNYTLRYAMRHRAQWFEPRVIVTNRHFFLQPAESPS